MTDTQYKFADIAPYFPPEFHEKMTHLVNEPGFEHAVKWVIPDIDFPQLREKLLTVPDTETFHTEVMMPFLEMLAKGTTSGVSMDGLEHIDPSKAYTIITNHRDIVLDTSFLNLCFLRAGYPSTQVAIGNNLLVYEWISDLVRLNGSFIVKRDLPRLQALEAARELSAYIHYSICELNKSVWIAERQGRSKDSNDMAQDSLVKMLGLSGEGDFRDNLAVLNIIPVSISYEYDPNDYLKAREFLLRRLDPDFKKSQRDDLLAMETGLLQPKGSVHFTVGRSLRPMIEELDPALDKSTLAREVCKAIDCQIHSGYAIFPINYVAYDLLHSTQRFADRYTPEDVSRFEDYVKGQLAKLSDMEPSKADYHYLYEMMLTMYANPLKNHIEAEESCSIVAGGQIE